MFLGLLECASVALGATRAQSPPVYSGRTVAEAAPIMRHLGHWRV